MSPYFFHWRVLLCLGLFATACSSRSEDPIEQMRARYETAVENNQPLLAVQTYDQLQTYARNAILKSWQFYDLWKVEERHFTWKSVEPEQAYAHYAPGLVTNVVKMALLDVTSSNEVLSSRSVIYFEADRDDGVAFTRIAKTLGGLCKIYQVEGLASNAYIRPFVRKELAFLGSKTYRDRFDTKRPFEEVLANPTVQKMLEPCLRLVGP